MNREQEIREQIKAEMRTWPISTLVAFIVSLGVRRLLLGELAAKQYARRFFPDLRIR